MAWVDERLARDPELRRRVQRVLAALRKVKRAPARGMAARARPVPTLSA
jgi:hypothetical protein